MSRNFLAHQRIIGACAVGLLNLATVAACQSSSDEPLDPDMGNATPVASPPAGKPDTGSVVDLPESIGPVREIAASDSGVVAARGDKNLLVGTAESLRKGKASTVNLDDQCSSLTATYETFVVACGDAVWLVPAAAPKDVEKRSLDEGEHATVAALMSSGELVTGNDESNQIYVHAADSDGKTKKIGMEEATTQLVTVPSPGQPDRIVRAFNPVTTVQDVDLDNDRAGGRLRVGLGLGRISPGTDGILLASDTTGNQLAVYVTNDDVIRLHQTVPVDPSPWAVAWDQHNELAWVASTAKNTVTGYDLSTGVPVQKKQLATIGDATSMVALPDGTLVLGSATSPKLHLIDAHDPQAKA